MTAAIIYALAVTLVWVVFPLSPKLHEYKDLALSAIGVCSVLHSFSPPWDWRPVFVTEGLKEFPRLQNIFYKTFDNRFYRLYVFTVGYIAINARSTIWARAISIKKQLADAAQQRENP